jgi:hypothetical protein
MQKDHSPNIVQSIDDYLNGKLDSSQVDALWIQLMQHPEHFSLLETQAALKKIDVADFRTKLEAGYLFFSNDNSKRKKWLWRDGESKTPWISALAAVILITLLLNLFRTSVEIDLSPALAQIHASHLVSPDVSRSSTDDMTELERGLYRAYLLSVSGNLDGAISEYESLTGQQEPGLSWIRYNLAIVHYNTGNYLSSAGLFREVDCTAIFKEPGRSGTCNWFKTNSFVAAGDLELALESGKQTMEQSVYYRNDAIDMLRKIRYVLEKDG